MSDHHGSCHCGAVTLTLMSDPVEVGSCNCSLCRRIGGLWHYCRPDEARIGGAEQAYRQGDCSLDTWHCPNCGCTTHWTAVDPDYQRMGINIRMFSPELWEGLPVRLIDGASY